MRAPSRPAAGARCGEKGKRAERMAALPLPRGKDASPLALSRRPLWTKASARAGGRRPLFARCESVASAAPRRPHLAQRRSARSPVESTALAARFPRSPCRRAVRTPAGGAVHGGRCLSFASLPPTQLPAGRVIPSALGHPLRGAIGGRLPLSRKAAGPGLLEDRARSTSLTVRLASRVVEIVNGRRVLVNDAVAARPPLPDLGDASF